MSKLTVTMSIVDPFGGVFSTKDRLRLEEALSEAIEVVDDNLVVEMTTVEE